jgi:hypothetical protein
MMTHVNISYNLNEKDLECSICYNPIQPSIYSCINCFTMYLCEECYKKTIKCPSCRNKTLYHHKQLEHFIQWDKCTNTNCPVQLLPWGINSHLECCEYQPLPCPFCSSPTTVDTISSHLKECLESEWVERNSNDTSGSLETLPRIQFKSLSALTIDMNEWNMNLFISLPKAIILISKDKRVGIISEGKVDCYFQERDDICWTQTALTISPMTLRTLNNNKSKLPVIPSNVDVIGIRTTTAEDEISLDSMESFPDDIQEEN